ncbi:MAG TPA: hypothetical protein VKU79_02755 [Thermoplasmataceae archaeon]|nr:hypothetical protein [Thermoplasmatales archaeon AK]HLH85767.1 hypothetical protein [Thermoplasmataceae archaeon]
MNRPALLFPLTLGLSDGIITTLMLISRTLISGEAFDVSLVVRVATGSAFVGGFSFFIAEYSRLRAELSRTSRQLILKTPRYLLKGKIGRDILLEAGTGTAVSTISGFGGSLVPLLSGMFLRSGGPISIGLALASLAALGGGVGKSVNGNVGFWVVVLVSIGIIVTIMGNFLNLV